MCSWDVIWRNLYKCGCKRSKVHLSRLSPFHFRSPAFWVFFGSQIVPNLQDFLTILLASMFEITGFHRVRNYDVTSFTSFLLLGDFGALGTLGVSTSWSPNIQNRNPKSLPSASILFFPKKKMSPPKQKYGDCVRGLYKYIIIDISLSSKSSVISTSFEMSWTGGHPQLLRWFCRAARTSALDSTRIRTSGRLAGCDGFRKKTCKGQQCATVQWLARLFKYCVWIYEWYSYRVVCAIHNICNHLHIYVAYLRHGDSSRVPKKLCCEVSFALSDTHFESKKHWKGWLPLLPTLWFHWSILIRAQEVNICHGTCMAQSSLSKQMYGDIWGTYGYGTSYFHQVFSHISSPPISWFLNASKIRLESSCFTTAACKSFSSSDWLALEHLNGCELSGMDDPVALTLPTYSDWFPFDIIHTGWPESLVSGFAAEAHIDKDRNSWILLQNRCNFI